MKTWNTMIVGWLLVAAAPLVFGCGGEGGNGLYVPPPTEAGAGDGAADAARADAALEAQPDGGADASADAATDDGADAAADVGNTPEAAADAVVVDAVTPDGD